MSNFCPDQGRTRVCGEAYACTPQPGTRGERRAGQKGPFMDGHYLTPQKSTKCGETILMNGYVCLPTRPSGGDA